MIKLAITNLGKYNEGYLVYEWLTLPYVDGELEELLEDIGINKEYEEFFISDYETDLNIEIGEYENIEKLNDLVIELERFNEDISVINGIIENSTGDLAGVVEVLAEGNYSIIHNVINNYELGIEIYEIYHKLEHDYYMYNYIDFERLGRDSGYTLIDDNLAIDIF